VDASKFFVSFPLRLVILVYFIFIHKVFKSLYTSFFCSLLVLHSSTASDLLAVSFSSLQDYADRPSAASPCLGVEYQYFLFYTYVCSLNHIIDRTLCFLYLTVMSNFFGVAAFVVTTRFVSWHHTVRICIL
jgi:hypothetical protein